MTKLFITLIPMEMNGQGQVLAKWPHKSTGRTSLILLLISSPARDSYFPGCLKDLWVVFKKDIVWESVGYTLEPSASVCP